MTQAQPMDSMRSWLAFSIALEISSYEVSLTVLTVRSTTETVGVGTRNDMPVSFPFTSGIARPTAFAAEAMSCTT